MCVCFFDSSLHMYVRAGEMHRSAVCSREASKPGFRQMGYAKARLLHQQTNRGRLTFFFRLLFENDQLQTFACAAGALLDTGLAAMKDFRDVFVFHMSAVMQIDDLSVQCIQLVEVAVYLL